MKRCSKKIIYIHKIKLNKQTFFPFYCNAFRKHLKIHETAMKTWFIVRARKKNALNTINLNLIRECHLKNCLSGVGVYVCFVWRLFSLSLSWYGVLALAGEFFFYFSNSHTHKLTINSIEWSWERKKSKLSWCLSFGINNFYWTLKMGQEEQTSERTNEWEFEWVICNT